MLILSQLFLGHALNNSIFFKGRIIEGVTSMDNSLKVQLQKQSGDIDYLKGRVNDVDSLKKQVTDLNVNVNSLSNQVKQILISQKSFTTPEINNVTDSSIV
jgi:seryl-tRNA synthetase